MTATKHKMNELILTPGELLNTLTNRKYNFFYSRKSVSALTDFLFVRPYNLAYTTHLSLKRAAYKGNRFLMDLI
jgi:hypothetical protein